MLSLQYCISLNMGGRKWFRDYFTDHPLYKANVKPHPDAVWANKSRDKIKEVGQTVLREEDEIRQGKRTFVRGIDEIKLSLFDIPADREHKWLECRSSTLITHLRGCERTNENIRERARQYRDINATPTSRRIYSTVPHANQEIVSPRPQRHPAIELPLPGLINYGDPYRSTSTRPPSTRPPSAQASTMVTMYQAPYQPAPGHHLMHGYPNNPYAIHPGDSVSRYNSPDQSIISSSSYTNSVASYYASDMSRAHSPAVSSQSVRSGHASKKLRTSNVESLLGKRSISTRPSQGSLHDQYNALADGGEADNASNTANLHYDLWMPSDSQDMFEKMIGRLTASAGFPLSWVTNPEFIEFCKTFIPNAVVPSRKSLTRRIIPSILSTIRIETRSRAAGKLLTVQCDGWTGENSIHFVAFMASAAKQLYTVRVNDTTIERKTAENLLVQMEDVILHLESDWRAKVIAFTTDASGESKKARSLLQKKCPRLVTPDCYAHQINLIVGDYFKTKGTEFLTYAQQANELITWLRSKTALLGLIREELTRRNKPALSVIRPVPTRWTAYYLAYNRLLLLRKPLENIVEDDESRPPRERHVIQPSHDTSTREKATRMVSIIKNETFWHAITRIKHHLTPLAIAANVTQAAHCRLDDVVMTFGNLVMEFQKLTDYIDAPVREALIGSIERRWNKSDQDVFIAAVILNPFLQTAPFNPDPLMVSVGAVYSLFERLWMRFFETDTVPDTLYTDTRDYLNGEGFFLNMAKSIKVFRNRAAGMNKTPDPFDVYRDITLPKVQPSPFITLAYHILSICPNSASCERLFSLFGLILTKLRTRMSKTVLVNLAELKMHIRDEYVRDNKPQLLRGRAFGIKSKPVNAQQPPTAGTGAGPSVDVIMQPSGSALSVTGQPSSPPPQDVTITPTPHDMPDLEDITDHPSDIRHTGGSRNASTRALERITGHLVQLAEEDELEDDTEFTRARAPNPRISVKKKITDIFSLGTSDFWKAMDQRSAIGSLDEEMEFHELLDLDAEGEPDLDPDLDDAVASLYEI
ncbi:hypothetical protein D9613_009287 [Agrocybe pediades]|uniref:DUF659 domain-containing protein n=1 Tax=Agrocybe pediades TaxID=84607 RepID=A0A8H4VTP6_9AGAR|nr:hypothetical protein D9613_009287 [Agrocybe pediades]